MKNIFTLFLFIYSGLLFASQPLLVEVDWLEKNLNSEKIRLIDMSDDTQFQRFHIPGATHLPYSAINLRNKKGVSFSVGKKQMIKILGFLGIQSHHHIVIYDDMGGLHAGRLFWELEKLGHKKVSLLNGGLVKWILSGKKVTAKVKAQAKPVQYDSNKNSINNVATLNDILNTSFNEKNILLDVRSKEEYAGHPRYPRSGHIPKAKWWEWQQSVNFENAFTMQKSKTLTQHLSSLGVKDKDSPITLYCRSAHRASQSYFTLRNLGFKNVKIYDGSMAEYGTIKSAPLNKGMNP